VKLSVTVPGTISPTSHDKGWIARAHRSVKCLNLELPPGNGTMKRKNITQEELKALLSYEPETGLFRWKVKPNRRIMIGQIAGRICQGRRSIRIDGVDYLASRLAWLYVKGVLPESFVDHRDTNPANDRIDNLRLASPSQNSWNMSAMRNNKSGYKGVFFCNKTRKFLARIAANNKTHHLGSFRAPEDAHAAYISAANELHGEFARVS
jgi:hypothetical protein